MTAEKFLDTDYAEVCSWWEKHEWPKFPLSLLPKTGFIVRGVAAGFMYDTDSGVGILEWVVSNPDSDKIKRNEALDLVVKSLLEEGKRMGKTFMFTSSNNKNLIERFVRHGFNLAEQDVTHMARGV